MKSRRGWILGLVAAVLVVSLVIWLDSRSGIAATKFARLRVGMHRQAVDAIIGETPHLESLLGLGRLGSICTYGTRKPESPITRRVVITVEFDADRRATKFDMKIGGYWAGFKAYFGWD